MGHPRASDAKKQAQNIVDAVDKLVGPLDKILVAMRSGIRLQRLTAVMAATAIFGVGLIVVYDFTYAARSRERLEERSEQIAAANEELRKVADTITKKVTDTEKKIDLTQESVDKQPEVKFVEGVDGGAPTPVIVIKEHTKKKKDEPKTGPSSSPTATEIQLPLKLPAGTVVTSGPSDAGSPQEAPKK